MSEGESCLPCLVYRRSALYAEKDKIPSLGLHKIKKNEIPSGINGIRKRENGDGQSELDSLLFHRWNIAMEKGFFRYSLDHVKTRVIPGKRGFVAQFNDKRTTERRKAPPFTNIRQTFNPKNFHFNKIKDGEKLFSLCPQEEENALQGLGKGTNLVIINDSPVDVGHVLLVPSSDLCLPQVLTEDSLCLAMDILSLSIHRGLRVCWNSLGALASVNHLHFHLIYLDYPLLIERIETNHLSKGCYEIVNQSTRGFAFQLNGNTADSLARLVFKVSDYLTNKQIPHNMCMSHGAPFSFDVQDDSSKNNDLNSIRVLLWPKKPMFDFKDNPPFLNACVEPAGFLVIKDFNSYLSLTEDEANSCLENYSLDEDEFNHLKVGSAMIYLL